MSNQSARPLADLAIEQTFSDDGYVWRLFEGEEELAIRRVTNAELVADGSGWLNEARRHIREHDDQITTLRQVDDATAARRKAEAAFMRAVRVVFGDVLEDG